MRLSHKKKYPLNEMMKLKHAAQITKEQLIANTFDIIIAASGYESRCTYLMESINLKNSRLVVLNFAERKEEGNRKRNDNFFKDNNFESHTVKEGDYLGLINSLNLIFKDYLFSDSLDILIDYSCMTKVWYSTMINYFTNKKSKLLNIKLTFSYTPSKFTEPKKPMPNKYMGPIPGIFRVSASNKPTALIIGLGYEYQRAKGIAEYLDPERTYAFYSKPAFDSKFEEKVKNNNIQLIKELKEEGENKVFEYPVMDLRQIDSMLTSLCLKLKNDYQIILAPLGPKPFALMCLLIASKYNEIDVWRVSAGSSGNIYDRVPSGQEPVICEVSFETNKPTVFE